MEANGKPTWIHFVGICGVALSAEAVAFHKAGYKVTGSDKGFFPPVSTNLEKAGVPFYAGWHPEKMGKPDLVVIGTASGSENPETAKARELGISELSDAQVRGQYFTKQNAIVTAGTWGKTSSTALLAHILREAGKNPSYVVGGIPSDFDPAELSESLPGEGWSV
ncbi:MAG TPA: Mur ligase domain-containing protein, partial [Candidatus Paceibacterota bacterium]